MRRIFDHATIRLLSRGTGVNPLPDPIQRAIVGDGTQLTGYNTPFMVAFTGTSPNAVLTAMRIEASLRKIWGPTEATEGAARLEYALTIASQLKESEKAIAEVHEALGKTYEERFWWEGDAAFALKAEPHIAAVADYYAKHEPESAMVTIYARARDELRQLIEIVSQRATSSIPPAPETPKKRSWI